MIRQIKFILNICQNAEVSNTLGNFKRTVMDFEILVILV